MKTFQVSNGVSLPCREDNLMRLCFEPLKINDGNLIKGLDSGEWILENVFLVESKLLME